jgi:hypothetical protein
MRRQFGDGVDVADPLPYGRGGGVDAGQPGEQLPQHDGDLPAGQVRAETRVRARRAEADVPVGERMMSNR